MKIEQERRQPSTTTHTAIHSRRQKKSKKEKVKKPAPSRSAPSSPAAKANTQPNKPSHAPPQAMRPSRNQKQQRRSINHQSRPDIPSRRVATCSPRARHPHRPGPTRPPPPRRFLTKSRTRTAIAGRTLAAARTLMIRTAHVRELERRCGLGRGILIRRRRWRHRRRGRRRCQ